MKSRTKYLIGIFLIVCAIIIPVMGKFNNGHEITPLTEKWELAVPYQEIPAGLNSLYAEDCGKCHKEHFKEWKTSTHAQAWNDLQFQSELKKESSPYFCINCHIPLQNQQAFIVDGYIGGDLYKPHRSKNQKFDKRLQAEGVTCAACHVRGNAIIGPTGSSKAPHTTIKDPEFLKESLCLNCHNAVANITPELSCSFETGDEWNNGPFRKKKNCISCHMQETHREIVPGYGARKSRVHYFSGSGIPKHDSLTTTMLNGLEYYPGTISSEFALNEVLEFSIKLKNEHAGHKVPTGDPERFILVTFKIVDQNGEILDISNKRIGEEWEWYPKAKKISENNIKQGESRVFDYTWATIRKGSFNLVVEVTKHRMDKKTADYNKLNSEYPLKVLAFRKAYFFEVN